MNYVLFIVILLGLVGEIVSPPVDPKRRVTDDDTANKPGGIEEELKAIAYFHYLQQVVQALEEDEEFAGKVKNVTKEDIESGKVAEELQFVKHNVRTKLDELKRLEMERLRNMVQIQHAAEENNGQLSPPPGDGRQWRSLPPGDDPKRIKIPQHIDLKNPHTFEMEDLKNLIKTASVDIIKLNEKRTEEFKQYEMEKEHAYRESLKHMTEEERKVAESKHQEMINKHKDHPEVHHPGSKQQLEQVWEDVDKLPVEEFDPKTFFRMHDINGDGFWDEEEVKALVALEVRKMYNISNEEDDPVEMYEEFNRMEEHIFSEADTNSDRLISLTEFIDMTKRADFDKDPGWKGIDEQDIFTPEELEAYERQQAAIQASSAQANQQYAYQPVEGVAPSNQGVQFQPNQGPPGPVQQQPLNPVPVQISQGDASQLGGKTGQPIPPVQAQQGQNPNPN